MKEVNARLEQWTKSATHEGQFVIWGDINGDTQGRWMDGTRIHTSGIKDREVKEGDIVETRNSVYLLGQQRVDQSPDEDKDDEDFLLRYSDFFIV